LGCLVRSEAYLGRSRAPSGFPLRIKTYYILCSSADSKLSIVVRPKIRKTFLMHIKEASKPAKNQRSIALRNNTAPLFHRKSTVLSTDGMLHATRARDTRSLMHCCAAEPL